MNTLSVEEAKEKLVELIDHPTGFGSFFVRREDGPLVKISAELAPEDGERVDGKRRLGFLKGEFTVPDDIKTPFEKEINAMFEVTEPDCQRSR